MSRRPPAAADPEGTIVFESSRGRHPDNARDCSDEFLPEGEQISDEERAELRKNRRFKVDWGVPTPPPRRRS